MCMRGFRRRRTGRCTCSGGVASAGGTSSRWYRRWYERMWWKHTVLSTGIISIHHGARGRLTVDRAFVQRESHVPIQGGRSTSAATGGGRSSLRDSASSASVNSGKGIMYYYRMNRYGFYADIGKACDETDGRTDSAFQTTLYIS